MVSRSRARGTFARGGKSTQKRRLETAFLKIFSARSEIIFVGTLYLTVAEENSVLLANMTLFSSLFAIASLRSSLNGRSCFSNISEQRGSGAKKQRRYNI